MVLEMNSIRLLLDHSDVVFVLAMHFLNKNEGKFNCKLKYKEKRPIEREIEETLYLDMASSKAWMRTESSHKSPSFPIPSSFVSKTLAVDTSLYK